FYFGRIIVLALVATYGTAAIAANAVAGTIVLFEVLPGFAIGKGLTIVIARCVGAGDFDQARYYNKKILLIVYAAHMLINCVILALTPGILTMYNLSSEAQEVTGRIIFWHGVLSVTIWPLAYTLPVTFRAAADARFPMYIGFATMFACRICMAWLLGSHMGMGVFGTWVAMFFDWLIKAAIYVWRYFSGKWTTFKAI
ncbi:MAG: MATE family efflux transporter, partial [Planctomycetes bacterium]|nr:MATE family efflux transporter [Planctomycetota bacterium]